MGERIFDSRYNNLARPRTINHASCEVRSKCQNWRGQCHAVRIRNAHARFSPENTFSRLFQILAETKLFTFLTFAEKGAKRPFGLGSLKVAKEKKGSSTNVKSFHCSRAERRKGRKKIMDRKKADYITARRGRGPKVSTRDVRQERESSLKLRPRHILRTAPSAITC